MTRWADYVGLEFRDKGRGPDAFDCWGLVIHFYKREYGISLPSLVGDYDNHLAADQIARLCAEESAKWRKVGKPEPGDVIMLRWTYRPMHVGIVCGASKFIHADSENLGSVIESWESPNWQRRVVGFFRHEERLNGGS